MEKRETKRDREVIIDKIRGSYGNKGQVRASKKKKTHKKTGY